MREKLLRLMGRIGRDTRLVKTTTHVLVVLWEWAHVADVETQLLECALDEHLAILSDSYSVKEHVKKQYMVKCVEDIKEVRTYTSTGTSTSKFNDPADGCFAAVLTAA